MFKIITLVTDGVIYSDFSYVRRQSVCCPICNERVMKEEKYNKYNTTKNNSNNVRLFNIL